MIVNDFAKVAMVSELRRERALEAHEREWVDARALQSDRPVQMRTGGSAGRADEPYDVTARDRIVALDDGAFEMCQQRIEALTVVDDHGVAREVQRLGESHASAGRRVHGGARRAREIDSVVTAARDAVEH